MPDPSGPAGQSGGPASAAANNPADDAAQPAPPARRLPDAGIFFGADGLRAGWGLLLFLVPLLYCVFPLLQAIFPRSSGAAALEEPGRLLAYEGMALLSVALAAWLMAKIERRPNSAYGLGGEHRPRNFLCGFAWGLALLSLLVFSLRACGLLVFDARLPFGLRALRYGAAWLAGFLLVGLFEEYFFRGYLQFTLARGINGIHGWLRASGAHASWLGRAGQNALGFWTAALLLSFGFGFMHRTNGGESPIGLLAAALIGVVFCLSLWRTGSLWWAIGFHAAWDWAQSFLFGVADSGIAIQGHLFSSHPVGRSLLSGGLTGPEGSLFIFPIIGLAAVVILVTLPRAYRGHASAGTRHPVVGLDLQ